MNPASIPSAAPHQAARASEVARVAPHNPPHTAQYRTMVSGNLIDMIELQRQLQDMDQMFGEDLTIRMALKIEAQPHPDTKPPKRIPLPLPIPFPQPSPQPMPGLPAGFTGILFVEATGSEKAVANVQKRIMEFTAPVTPPIPDPHVLGHALGAERAQTTTFAAALQPR